MAILRRVEDPSGGARVLVRVTTEYLQTPFASLCAANGVTLATTGESDDEEVSSCARACLSSLSPEVVGRLSGVPLVIDRGPVGVLVVGSHYDRAAPGLTEIQGVAALLALACAGGPERILDMRRFEVAVNRERERSVRAGESFALLAVDPSGVDPSPVSALEGLPLWIRRCDTVGWLGPQKIGILMPHAEAVGAEIAAHRVREFLLQETGQDVRVGFKVFRHDPRTGECELPHLEEGSWKFVQDVC